MRPDLPQDHHPEHEVVPPPRDPRAAGFGIPRYDGRYDAAPASGSFPGVAPGHPYSGPQAAVGPWSGQQPRAGGPSTGAHPAAGPYSGPQQVPSGSWPAASEGLVGAGAAPTGGYQGRYESTRSITADAAAPTVRRQPSTGTLSASDRLDAAARRREGDRHDDRYAGYARSEDDRHPSGPLPTARRREQAPRRDSGRRLMIALLAAGAVVAGAGGYVALAHWGASSDAASSSSSVAPAAGQAAAVALTGANLGTTETPLGIVATSDGYTVYSFSEDSKSPSTATCTDACAQQWPPVLASDTPWLKGVNPSDVGTVDRPDGTRQLTLGGWPVYRYAKDTAPGQTTGNGVGGTWKAVGPNGKAVAPQAAAPSASSAAPAPAAGGSYGAASPAPAGGGSYGPSGSSGSSGSSYGSSGY